MRVHRDSGLPERHRKHDVGGLSPTPRRERSSSIVRGTLPPKRSTISVDAEIMLRALARKNPHERMSVSNFSCGITAKSSGLPYSAKSFSVTILTRLSVHCAESMTATSNWKSVP